MATDTIERKRAERTTFVRAPLGKERILAAALALVDREGLAALSMRRLGSELGVKGMSIYNHIPNKSALLFGLINSMFAEIVLTDVNDVSWKDQVRTIMHSFRKVGLSHPSVFLLYASRSWDAVRVNRRDADHLLLRRAGFTEEEAAYGMRTLSSYVLGFVAREVESLSPDTSQWDDTDEDEEATAPPMTSEELEKAFDFGLETILSGMESRLNAP